MAGHRVAVFGCGFVAPPIIRYLNRLGIKQVVATRTPAKVLPVVKLLKRPELVEVLSCDVNKDKDLVSSLVAKSDAVASVLPASTHLPVLQQCVAHGVSAVTPSTVSDTIAALDAPAKQAGILLLNECGQSPGLDHVETVRLAAQVHAAGGKVKGYTSLTGSLAIAEGLDNPLKAKLTWSPRGCLMHSWNPARYLDNGATVDVAWNELFLPKNLGTDEYFDLGKVAWFLNRDATAYVKLYGLNDVLTAKRGVHDYPTAMPFLRALQQTGLTSLNIMEDLTNLTHLQFCQKVLGMDATGKVKDGIRAALEKCDGVNAEDILTVMDHIGLLSNETKVPKGPSCALEVVAAALDKIVIRAGEKDSAVNKQIMQVEMKDGSWEEWQSILEVEGEYLGEQDDSAAAKGTALPVAVAVKLLLDKKMPHDIVGVHRPLLPNLYNPILSGLEELGVQCRKITKKISPPV